MADKFRVVRQVECDVCHGKGKFEHPDGDIERCTACRGIGHWDTEATVEDVLRECGAQAQPVTDQQYAAAALDMARQVFVNGTAQHASAAALVAIAEQLAALNVTMAEIAESQHDLAQAAIWR